MYRNHIRNRAENRLPQFSIDLSEIGPDPRVKFVEHVCRTLSESRMGADYIFEAWPVVTAAVHRPDLDPTLVCDPRLSLGRAFRHGRSATGAPTTLGRAMAKRALCRLPVDIPQGRALRSLTSANLGRGSP